MGFLSRLLGNKKQESEGRVIAKPIWTTDMRQLARQLIEEHGNLMKVECQGNNVPILVFADGHKMLGQTDLPMFLCGYSGTRPRNLYMFLNEAGFNVSYEDVVNMTYGSVLQRKN